jgi:hypothetical protein
VLPVTVALKQGDLFGREVELPQGTRYAAELIPADEEQALLTELRALPFKEFEFHGFLGAAPSRSAGGTISTAAACRRPATFLHSCCRCGSARRILRAWKHPRWSTRF